MKEDFQKINAQIIIMMKAGRKKILAKQANPNVATKSSRLDLVTDIDRMIEKFYENEIHRHFPAAKILGEEGLKQEGMLEYSGLFFVIDPIDGTMNFVKQKEHYASMVAVYAGGQPALAYIYDIVNDKLLSGGPALGGVFCNGEKITAPADLPLSEGLFGGSWPMVINNYHGVQAAIKQSSGLRIYGSAGIEYLHVILGQCICYLSHLRPWDFLPGKILAESLGLSVVNIDGSEVNVLSSNDVLVAPKRVCEEVLQLLS
ncbi:inositol monophosphatase family protein [Ligilactobacillus equi]|uniref:Fructose-1 6-bisphosphatase n=1 Tax=Ligilactobacillus equi DPC 6820 TaxID=1392007 RepID=V7I0B7_9LACO|nr:inositol monophosphatase family protein [Ligilactobacillus equi]ETA74878.1 fructose-1 6-bisphosphatase [Ligilactobacillus equi DPC 6820]